MASPRTVVVTGASAGVGRATAHELARSEGARVALLARGRTGLENAAREVEDLGGTALPIVCDVSDAEAVEAAAQQAEVQLGPLDVWINNAMISSVSPFADMDVDEFQRITDVTYHGFVHGTRAALKRFAPRGAGVVVQVGSSLAYRGIPLQSAYCGAKHAIQGFTEAVRCELLHDGSKVHLTMVQLPAINTPQFSQVRNRMPNHPMPVPPIYEPEVAARAIVWATKHRRREVWLGSSTPATILGNAIAPTAMDHMLATTGWDSQMSDMPPADGPDYLFEPRDEDMGTHGRFGDQAKISSRQWAVTTVMPDWAAGLVSAAIGRALGKLQQ